MYDAPRRSTRSKTAFGMAELIYHSIVRDIRKTHRNAFMSLFMNIMQTVIFVGAFYAFFSVMPGLRSGIYQADFLLYIMSGIFLFLTHTKAMGAVLKSEGPTSPMMQHAPLNTLVTICASALGSLYIQVLSLIVVLFLYHTIFTPVVIDDPIGAFGMLLVAWISGVGLGICFLAAKPWFPDMVQIVSSVYSRGNMIASGKMFVANTMPSHLLPLFAWNPLFHAIDQCRGYAFINYTPHNSSLSYPLVISAILIVIGLMAEHHTRKHASISWGAGR